MDTDECRASDQLLEDGDNKYCENDIEIWELQSQCGSIPQFISFLDCLHVDCNSSITALTFAKEVFNFVRYSSR